MSRIVYLIEINKTICSFYYFVILFLTIGVQKEDLVLDTVGLNIDYIYMLHKGIYI